MKTTIYVSPSGNDAHDGYSPDASFQTLHVALEKARALRTDSTVTPCPITIRLAEGTYALDTTIELSAADAFLAIEGSGDGTILHGGMQIQEWEKESDHFFSAPVAGVQNGDIDFRQLFVNGEARPRAHLPATGRYTHESRFDQPWLGTNFGQFDPPPTLEALSQFVYAEGQLPADFSVRNAEFTFFHNWDDSKVRSKSHDPVTRTIHFQAPCGYPPGAFGNRTYTVENLREGMLRPGQWYLDRDAGRVVYWPMPGETMDSLVVEAGRLHQLVRAKTTEDAPLRGLRLRNLRMRLATVDLKSTGCGAAHGITGAIELHHAQDTTIENVTIDSVGGHGIFILGDRTNVVECDIQRTGTCGIVLRGEDNAIRHNRICHVGQFYPGAVGINSTGPRLHISHNDIQHSPYSGIMAFAGSASHFGDPVDGNMRIEHNHIAHVMKTLHDGGGIYCVGRGNTIRNNRIHDLDGGTSVGIYVDEVSENFLIEQNVVYNAQGMILQCHAGDGILIQHNLFHASENSSFTFPRSKTIDFNENIILTAAKPLSWLLPEDLRARNNLFWPDARGIGSGGIKIYSSYPPVSNHWGLNTLRFDTFMIDDTNAACKSDATAESRHLGTVPRVSTAPTESDWHRALVLPLLVSGDEEIAPPQTDSRLLRDADSLYLRVLCYESSDTSEQELTIWQSQHIELFLKPDLSQAAILQFAVSSYDQSMAYRNPGADEIASDVDWSYRLLPVEGGWGVELRLPISSMQQLAGESPRWGIYLGRADERADVCQFFNDMSEIPAFIHQDPGLCHPEAHDYRLRTDGTAYQQGWPPFLEMESVTRRCE